MSADNWAICPRCLDRELAAARAKQVEADAAYGTATQDEYEALLLEARKPIDPEKFRTFREDYEFYGASDGVVTADYGGACSVCHLSVELKATQPFYERGSAA